MMEVLLRPDAHLLDLQRVRVSEADKQRLLRPANVASQTSAHDAESLLQSLERVYPNARDEFSVKSFAENTMPLRLLCECSDDGQYKPDTYIALSYCWHNNDWASTSPYQERQENGRDWPISVLLLQEMLGLRESKYEGLWIDQISIRQDDPVEKANAVGTMDVIYSSARLVVVVLEDVLLSKSEQDLLCQLLYSDPLERPGVRRLDVVQGAMLNNVIFSIFSARWFTRAWCSQEFRLSTTTIVLVPCEDDVVRLKPSDLRELFKIMQLENDAAIDPAVADQDDRADITEQAWSMIVQYDDFDSRIGDKRPTGGFTKTYRSLFTMLTGLSCTEPRDKISIALNVSGLPLTYKGPPRTENSVRWIISLLALAAGDASVLCGTEEFIIEDPDAGVEPWLQSNLELPKTLRGAPYLPSLEGITRLTNGSMTTDLLLLQKPTLNPATADSFSRARRFVQFCTSKLPNDLFGPHSFGVLEADLCVETIACSLDCGIDWILKQVSVYYRSRGDGIEWADCLADFRMSGFDKAMHEILFPENDIGYYQEFTTSSAANTLGNTNTIGQYEEQSRSTFEGLCIYFWLALRFRPFTLRTVAALSDVTPEWPICTWVDLGSGQKALTLTPGSAMLSDPNIRLAVPVVLADVNCAEQRRLWILERFPGSDVDDNQWSIVAKSSLVTFRAVSESEGRVELCRGATIRGRPGTLEAMRSSEGQV